VIHPSKTEVSGLSTIKSALPTEEQVNTTFSTSKVATHHCYSNIARNRVNVWPQWAIRPAATLQDTLSRCCSFGELKPLKSLKHPTPIHFHNSLKIFFTYFRRSEFSFECGFETLCCVTNFSIVDKPNRRPSTTTDFFWVDHSALCAELATAIRLLFKRINQRPIITTRAIYSARDVDWN
jgi:hypothetical protein